MDQWTGPVIQDLTINTNNGTPNTIAFVAGSPIDPQAACIYFNGSSSYITIPSPSFGNYPTSGSTSSYSISVEVWFKTSGGVILAQCSSPATPGGSAPSGYVPAIYVDTTGALRVSVFWFGSASDQIVANGPFNDGKWHHVVATYNNGTETLYVDSAQSGTYTGSQTSYASAYVYFLGTGETTNWANTPSGWFYFTGNIALFSVYPYALSAPQVLAHYNAARTGLVGV